MVCSIYLVYKIQIFHQLMKGLRYVLKINTQYFELKMQKDTEYVGLRSRNLYTMFCLSFFGSIVKRIFNNTIFHVELLIHLLFFRSRHLQMLDKIGVLKNFCKSHRKHLLQSLCLNKFAGLYAGTLLRKRFWFKCFQVNFVKFLRRPIL